MPDDYPQATNPSFLQYVLPLVAGGVSALTPGAGRGVATAIGLYDLLQGLNERRQYSRRQQTGLDTQTEASRRLLGDINAYEQTLPADSIDRQGPDYSPVRRNLSLARTLAPVDFPRSAEMFYQEVNRAPIAPPMDVQAAQNVRLGPGEELEVETTQGKYKRKSPERKFKITEFDDDSTGMRTVFSIDEKTGEELWRRPLAPFVRPSPIITETGQVGNHKIITFIDKTTQRPIKRLTIPNEKTEADTAMQHFRDNLALVVNGQPPAKGSKAEGLSPEQASAILETLKRTSEFSLWVTTPARPPSQPVPSQPASSPAPTPRPKTAEELLGIPR